MSRVMFTLGTMLRETGQVLDRIGCSMQGLQRLPRGHRKHRTVAGIYDKVPRSRRRIRRPLRLRHRRRHHRREVFRVVRHDPPRRRQPHLHRVHDQHPGQHRHPRRKDKRRGVAAPTTVGDRVTVGHNAILHACTIQDDAFVGMGATVMDGAVVEKGAMVAAGALVTPGTVVPSGQLWAGAAARFSCET